MARSLRWPDHLPVGARRNFALEIHKHYRAAKRPTLREISDLIRDDDELRGTASRETVRRMLLGEVVPASWHTVNAVFLVLCKLAGRDPNDGTDEYRSEWSWAEALEHSWHQALDEAPTTSEPISDPWHEEPPPF